MTSKDERYVSGVKTEVAVARTRERVASLLVDLSRRGLSAATLCERVPGADLFVTRPTDVEDDSTPEKMMVLSLTGRPVAGTPGESGIRPADVELYAAVLRELDGATALVHLETGHAAAWAARGREIPCLTAQAAREFGGTVPVLSGPRVDPVALIEALRGGAASVLVTGLGAFCVAASSREAVRIAHVLEGIARTATLAAVAGDTEPLSAESIADLSGRARLLREPITDGRR
ncbi:class II aldolase/adducin family protein [Microbacterium oleivorans]|uniref:class II aldolase/adducin family protein n=1 Tax=Microbacterium oleivorans TaxID=273677 RepID=UPI0020415874|nr:class II aldolase/adducin family protein [Microbacterium oleivorans]MCM3696102.1 class II aldolase/adducin family protein [Microbacterium oleivorans]